MLVRALSKCGEWEVFKCVRVCQSRTCKKQGAAAVLAAFQACSIPDVTVTVSGCLGQCGSGPMVVFLPEMVWYSRVQPQDVPQLVEQLMLNEGKLLF
ncbi:(2Fe-2S) ferredoxin domain-containing protein [Cronbergia sp. UHCC 0137]|uniref:(2Fe-2S) ferredoxin domain-containing protein n=1 Tax=Cronbergia sp. UHCC 0137 TaxID=3110239 RepID=UPI002B1F4CA3|nr:(2Fe-2S) ferredoxin domain-containing protein [Cronbergia sp. UHCC 0137]MEA5617475.1 (2Fe-2S) ferredoxin domain-containing protein [Cronbergia sp. UHCC 0137]